MRTTLRTLTAALTCGVAALSLAACAGATGGADSTPTPAAPTTSAAPVFPRTVEIAAGSAGAASTLVVPTQPTRIAALTYETAELVAALGEADKLVVVPSAVTNPALTNHLDEMKAGLLKPLPLKEGAERYAELYLIIADPEAAGPGTRRLAEILREAVADGCTRAKELGMTESERVIEISALAAKAPKNKKSR